MKHHTMMRSTSTSTAAVAAVAAAAAAAFLLGGCASFSRDGGFDKVAALTKDRTGQTARWSRNAEDSNAATARVDELLKQPLTAEAAVEIALLNNRGLQASFAELGIAEAEQVRAGRLANPSFEFGHTQGGGVTEIDRSVMFGVLGLLTMPLDKKLADQRFEQAQFQAAQEAVVLAGEARRTFFGAVAAQDLLKYFEQVHAAADASDELARRMVEAGNFSALAQLRHQAFKADAAAQLAHARNRAVAQRERLVRLLGLSGASLNFTLVERLPDLPDAPVESQDAEQTAIDRRLDVQIAKRATESTARALGLARATRFVNVFELGYANKSQTGETRRSGYAIRLELPLFDGASTSTARAQTLYRQSVDRTAEIAVNAQSQVRESHSAYRTAFELARHYRDDVVPLRQRISQEKLLRYNGMLIGVFDLLADSGDQIMSVTAYIEALRDFWIAQTNLQSALAGGLPTEVSMSLKEAR